MPNTKPHRYSDVAIFLHWLIALLIIGLLALGKFMTGLAEDDPWRFSLTQWHKTVGILVLLSVVIRLLWRITHTAPSHPANAPRWEKLAAGLSHVAMYLLIVAVPISGWMMVSASPLNIDTYLFNVIPWPHIPPLTELANRETWEHRFHEVHNIGSTALIVLLLVHIGAALKHHVINKDDVLHRMLPNQSSQRFWQLIGGLLVVTLLTSAGLHTYQKENTAKPIAGGSSGSITFTLPVSGVESTGTFELTDIQLQLIPDSPNQNTLSATVQMASANTDDPQNNSTMQGQDWFDSANHPTAKFQSTSIEPSGDAEYTVTGELIIKDTTLPVTFPMAIVDSDGISTATGTFEFERLDFKLGTQSQPDDHNVGYTTSVNFEIPLQ